MSSIWPELTVAIVTIVLSGLLGAIFGNRAAKKQFAHERSFHRSKIEEEYLRRAFDLIPLITPMVSALPSMLGMHGVHEKQSIPRDVADFMNTMLKNIGDFIAAARLAESLARTSKPPANALAETLAAAQHHTEGLLALISPMMKQELNDPGAVEASKEYQTADAALKASATAIASRLRDIYEGRA